MKNILNVQNVKHISSFMPWIEQREAVYRIMREEGAEIIDLGICLHKGRLYLVKWKDITEEETKRNKKYLRVPTSDFLFEVVETIALSSLR